MIDRAVRVVKVGGSLFGFRQLAAALRRWLAEQAPATHVLVAGGGAFADAVRTADARFSLGEETSHWLCIDALRVSARLLAALLPEASWTTTLSELRSAIAADRCASPIVFCPADFMRHVEPVVDDHPLPHTWAVTSDSIAARIAEVLGARELVLLKATDPPAEAGAAGDYVDSWFPLAAENIGSVRLVNLRAWLAPAGQADPQAQEDAIHTR